MKPIKKELINAKCLFLQEDFLKENAMIQIRMVLDRRNLKHKMENGDFMFESGSKVGASFLSFQHPSHTLNPGSLYFFILINS